tara:strand:- start:3096 stop:4661 length:1566 start_codon:yes stop_codon:yes gene_type:complete
VNPSTTLIYAVFTILLVPLGGVTLLVVLRLLRNRSRVRDLAITRVLLVVVGSSLLLVSAGGLAAVSAWGLHSDDGPGLLSAGLLADSMMFFLLATIGWAGFRSLQLSRNVQADIAEIDLLDFEERLSGLQLTGWSLVALPLLFVAPLLIPILMIPFALMEGPASSRRSKQCHLLWLLAIAVKQAQPLPPLLESYADSLGGATSFSPWRFIGFLRASRFQTHVHNMADRLRDGVPLPDAVEDNPGLLPRSSVTAIRVGYDSGCLPESLKQTAHRHSQFLQHTGATSDITTFFVYSATTMILVFSLCLYLMIFVAPRWLQIFSDSLDEVPQLTMAVITTADGIASHLFLAAPILSLPCLLLMATGICWFWGVDNLRIPWLTRLWPRLHSPGLLRCLSLALSKNGTLDHAFAVQLSGAHRPDMTVRLARVREKLAAGASGWAALRQERLITDQEEQVLECSQRMGNLPWALQLLADAADRRLKRRVLWCLQTARPILIGSLGLLVGVICVGFFQPLVQLVLETR